MENAMQFEMESGYKDLIDEDAARPCSLQE